ncbi:MAG: hypothetical protein K2F73_00485 [Ruminococcus sp.]|nr:hypothetical protein [Ruminococcus sp.]
MNFTKLIEIFFSVKSIPDTCKKLKKRLSLSVVTDFIIDAETTNASDNIEYTSKSRSISY